MNDKRVSVCLEHSGHESRISITEQSVISAHKRIDGLKNWVIAGMASLILQLGLTVIGLLIKLTG